MVHLYTTFSQLTDQRGDILVKQPPMTDLALGEAVTQ